MFFQNVTPCPATSAMMAMGVGASQPSLVRGCCWHPSRILTTAIVVNGTNTSLSQQHQQHRLSQSILCYRHKPPDVNVMNCNLPLVFRLATQNWRLLSTPNYCPTTTTTTPPTYLTIPSCIGLKTDDYELMTIFDLHH